MTPLPKLTPEQIDEAIRLPNGSLPCGIGTTREHAVNAARATEAARDQMWIEMLAGQEPVAWSVLDKRTGKHWYTHESKYTAQHYANEYSHREPDGSPSMVVTPLYTAPQPQPERTRELECVIADLTAECKSLRALLHKLVAIEGPQPGTAAWADEVMAALDGTAPQPQPKQEPKRRVTYVCPVCAASLERQE